jgi:hypothetical protein
MKGNKRESYIARTKPPVDTREGCGLIGGGVYHILISAIFCNLFVAGLIDEFGGIRTIRDIHLLEICGGLFGVFFACATGVGSIYMFLSGVLTHVQNRDWMRGAAKAHATIIDRREEQIITAFDYKYGGYTMTYELIIQVNDQPEVPELDGCYIRVDVSKRIFDKYARKDHVVIYYATQSPLTLILRGE